MTSTPHTGTLRVADLSASVRAWLLAQHFDEYVEKHEGPHDWRDLIEPESYDAPDPAGGRRTVQPEPSEFVVFDGRNVLLPVGRDHHEHLTRLRAVLSDDGRCLTLFLNDTKWGAGPDAGRIAFCELAPTSEWFLCTVWHAWYSPR